MNWRRFFSFGSGKNSSKSHSPRSVLKRSLRMESLESRQLLSVSPAECGALAGLYSELEWADSFQDLNLIEIDSKNLSESALLNAVSQAQDSAQNDVILVRTTAENRTIELTEALTLNLNSSVSGSLSIISCGEVSLRLTGELSTLVDAASGTIQFGGVTFLGFGESTGSGTLSLVSVSENANVRYSCSLFMVGSGLEPENELASNAASGLVSEPASESASNAVLEAVSELAPAIITEPLTVETGTESLLSADSGVPSGHLLTTTSGTSASVTRLNGTYYSVEFQVSGSATQWAYLAGLSAEDAAEIETQVTGANREWFSGQFLDAEKEDSNPDDDEMCWAASLSNMLWYSGWANESVALAEDGTPLFENEDEIFDYFCECFADYGGHTYYGINWFLTGNYEVQGNSGWCQIEVSGSGGFYSGDFTREGVITYSSSDDAETGGALGMLASMTSSLRSGDAIGLGIGWYASTSATKRNGGHAITCWGYVYDTSCAASETDYYVGLFITDSDDTQSNSAESSLNKLYFNQLSYDDAKAKYYFQGYSSYLGYLEDSVAVMPYAPQTDLSTQDGGTLSASTIHVGDALSLSNVNVSEGSKEKSHVFTVSVYASVDGTISADSDILLGSVTVPNLAKGASTSLTFEELHTENLTEGTTYSIGWIVNSDLDGNLTNNSGICETQLKVLEEQGLRTTNEAELSATFIPRGETFTVSGITVLNHSEQESGAFSVQIYASLDESFNPAGDVLLGTISAPSLAAGASAVLNSDELDSSLLASSSQYSIYWRVLNASGNESCVGVLPEKLSVLSAAFTAENYQALRNRYSHLDLPELEGGAIPSSLNVRFLEDDLSLETLQEAIDAAESSTGNDLIVLSATVVPELLFTSASQRLTIDLDSGNFGTLTLAVLDGNGGVLTLNGASLNQILQIRSGTVFLGGLEFKNGLATGSGGALSNADGVLVMEECVLTANSANNSSVISQLQGNVLGGAILNEGELRLFDCSASGNSAVCVNEDYGAYGGTICHLGTYFYAQNLQVTDSSSTTSGGALYLGAESELANCSLTKSTATYGGGIYSNAIATINDSEIKECTGTNGGGIFAASSTLTLTRTEVSACTATYGGAVMANQAMVSLTDSRIASSSATLGGGICAFVSEVTDSGSVFAENSAEYYGGAVYCEIYAEVETDSEDPETSPNPVTGSACALASDLALPELTGKELAASASLPTSLEAVRRNAEKGVSGPVHPQHSASETVTIYSTTCEFTNSDFSGN